MLLGMFIPTYLIICLIALSFATHWQFEFDAANPNPRSLSVWSGSTPMGIHRAKRDYLGPFGNDSVLLRIEDLSQHDSLVIEIDVYILGSWDGVVDDDRLTIVLDSNDTLLCSTFSNTAYKQSYPSLRARELHPSRAGAHETDVTGWTFTEPKIYNGPLDAGYRLRFTVPHKKSTVLLGFSAVLQDIRPIPANEAWGIGAVRVHLVQAHRAADPDGPIVVPGR